MGILRSERMKHGTLVLPTERARHFMNVVGKLQNCNIQFEDMNSQTMRRPYRKYIQRIDEMERILRFLMDELAKIPGATITKNNLENFLENDDAYKLDSVEAELKKLYVQFRDFQENNAQLTESKNAALEEKHVTALATQSLKTIMSGPGTDVGTSDLNKSLLADDAGAGGISFNNIAGTVLVSDQERFARTIFRATRGNTFTHLSPINDTIVDPKTGRAVAKSVFVIYFQDSKGTSSMSDKVKKICNAFGVNLYDWPASKKEADRKLMYLTTSLKERNDALEAYFNFLKNECAGLIACPRDGSNSLIED